MPDIGKITAILLIGLVLSIMGVTNMINRWRNGKAYRELREIKNPTKLTVSILDQCERLLKPTWWNWASLITMTLCLVGLIIDSYRN
jgi:hypothetical protein